jgi:hypothetical protein
MSIDIIMSITPAKPVPGEILFKWNDEYVGQGMLKRLDAIYNEDRLYTLGRYSGAQWTQLFIITSGDDLGNTLISPTGTYTKIGIVFWNFSNKSESMIRDHAFDIAQEMCKIRNALQKHLLGLGYLKY